MPSSTGATYAIAHSGPPDEPIPEFSPDHRWTREDVLAAMATATPRARCIITSEIGDSRSNYDPYTVSRTQDHGPAALNERGKLVTFFREGYTDPYSPWQALEFLESQLARGQGWAWVGDRDAGGWC